MTMHVYCGTKVLQQQSANSQIPILRIKRRRETENIYESTSQPPNRVKQKRSSSSIAEDNQTDMSEESIETTGDKSEFKYITTNISRK